MFPYLLKTFDIYEKKEKQNFGLTVKRLNFKKVKNDLEAADFLTYQFNTEKNIYDSENCLEVLAEFTSWLK